MHVQLGQSQQISFLRFPMNAPLRPANRKPHFMLAVDQQLKQTNDKHTSARARETETHARAHTHTVLPTWQLSR